MSKQLTLTGDSDFQEETLKPDFNHHGVDIGDFVIAASRVITPLGPISAFAARNPWDGLEDQTFDRVARWLKEIQDVDIYPSSSLLQSANHRGDIDSDCLEWALQHWLDVQSFHIPRDVSERFCRAALQFDALPSNLLASSKVKRLSDKLSGLKLQLGSNHRALQTYSRRLEMQGIARTAHDLNVHLIKWCKLYLDASNAAWSMPNRGEGFYKTWRRLVVHDPALSHSERKRLKNWPKEANDALKIALSALEISKTQIREYLEAHLLALPGWAGMMLWHSQQSTEKSLLLLEYLAVRISMEWALIQPHLLIEQKTEKKLQLEPLIAAWVHWGGLPLEAWQKLSYSEQKARLNLAYQFDDIQRRRVWLEAFELTYENKLKEKISLKSVVSKENQTVLAQFSFCIDVRSEPFRRELEKAGPFETLGTAGFFGLPIETNELGSTHSHSSLPVMQKPKHKIKEISSESEYGPYHQRRMAANSAHSAFKAMKQNLLTNLLLPEVTGPWFCLQMLTRSFFPMRAGRFFENIQQSWVCKPPTELTLDFEHEEDGLPVGFTDEEKVHYAGQALKMMGLTNHFAPLVVICGHVSRSTNNPYAAALDCGACGGASGGFNARVLATLCNLPAVRKALKNEGILIPEDTVFAAAEHITSTNELSWLYVPHLSHAAKKAFDEIQRVLQNISHEVNKDQLSSLPNLGSNKNPKEQMQRFAKDWSEVRPEWGLARNAAFIIGDRRITKGCNLGGRVFLQSYDWKKDHNGELLYNLVAGPATVAEWINLQYFASTVAPHYYGSGNKATQTVTAGIGVMQGNASDLLLGLPWQSVMKTDDEPYHVPLRLLLVIQAPKKYVERLFDNHPEFHQKVRNGWIRLASIDPQGHWETWS